MTDKIPSVEKMVDDLWEREFYNMPVIDLIILAKQQFKHNLLSKNIKDIKKQFNDTMEGS